MNAVRQDDNRMENAIYEGCNIPWSYVDPENSFAFLVAGSDLMKLWHMRQSQVQLLEADSVAG